MKPPRKTPSGRARPITSAASAKPSAGRASRPASARASQQAAIQATVAVRAKSGVP
jgi:hypothetical protein